MLCPATLGHNGVAVLNGAAVRHSRRAAGLDTHTWGCGSAPASGQLSPAPGTKARPQHRLSTSAALSLSTAFWGESDDSSSELEAALRPRTHGADSDDFDDFYD